MLLSTAPKGPWTPSPFALSIISRYSKRSKRPTVNNQKGVTTTSTLPHALVALLRDLGCKGMVNIDVRGAER